MTGHEPFPVKRPRLALDAAGRVLWHIPGRFAIATALDPSYSLRCVVFHDVSTSESAFTRGLGVTIAPHNLKVALKYLSKYYTPVSLQDVLDHSKAATALPHRAVLVTFDDGYASTIEWAVPLCRDLGVPAVFFLNAASLDNHRLAPDNLVCYVANMLGLEPLNAAARAVKGSGTPAIRSMADVFKSFFPSVSPLERRAFLSTLVDRAGFSERELAEASGLYLTRSQVLGLAAHFEIGNHTYNHVNCRTLSQADFSLELDRNKVELEALSGKTVRSFSVPYGSSADLTGVVARHLESAGHEAVFLSQSVANPRGVDPLHIDRVSIHAHSDHTMFLDIEVLPRLRAIRNRLFRPAHRDNRALPEPARCECSQDRQ